MCIKRLGSFLVRLRKRGKGRERAGTERRPEPDHNDGTERVRLRKRGKGRELNGTERGRSPCSTIPVES